MTREVFGTPGTFSWTAPAGIFNVSVIASRTSFNTTEDVLDFDPPQYWIGA